MAAPAPPPSRSPPRPWLWKGLSSPPLAALYACNGKPRVKYAGASASRLFHVLVALQTRISLKVVSRVPDCNRHATCGGQQYKAKLGAYDIAARGLCAHLRHTDLEPVACVNPLPGTQGRGDIRVTSLPSQVSRGAHSSTRPKVKMNSRVSCVLTAPSNSNPDPGIRS